jgi:hypothetical protein
MGDFFNKENKPINKICCLRTHTIGFKKEEKIKDPPQFSKENFVKVIEKVNKFIELNSMEDINRYYPKSNLNQLINFLRGEVYFTLE